MTRGVVARAVVHAGDMGTARRRIRALAGWVLLLCMGTTAALVMTTGQGNAEAVDPAERPEESQLPMGPELYLANCASCHGDQGQGTFRGPTLIGVGAASAHYWLASGRMPIDEPDEEPVRREPAFSEEEIALLVDYVARLGEGPSIPDLDAGAEVDLARGGSLYRLHCAACHNWDGKGGALVNDAIAPMLHPVPSLQVAEAIRIGPGAMPQFTEEQLSDDALADVVAYVDYLKDPRDAGGFPLAHWGPSTETVAAFVGIGVIVLLAAWLGERSG